jgi:hypothetical protein
MSYGYTQINADQGMPIASSSSASAPIGVDLWLSLLLLFVMCFVCGKGMAEKR